VKSFYPILMLALLAGCTSAIDPVEPPRPLTVITPELKADHIWVRQLGKGSHTKYLQLIPLVDGERVYQADNRGRVAAYGAFTGERLWRVELDARVNAGPAGSGELLLFGGDAEVIALNKEDGSLAWRAPVTSEVVSLPAQQGETVVVHAIDGNIIGLDANSGRQRWRHSESVPTLSLRGSGNPVIVDDLVLTGTANGKVVALGLNDGMLRWQTTVAVPRGRSEIERMVDVDADLAVADGVVYASSYQGNLVAMTLAGGQLMWSREIASASGISVDNEMLYVTDTSGDVWALSRRGGATMWKQEALHQRALTAPVQQGNYLIVGDFEGHLHWLSKEDGRFVARSRIQQWQDYFPVEDEFAAWGEWYPEDRAVLTPPAVQGVFAFGLDKRGVLDVFRMSPIAPAAE
jgi:outer membrane protein assembly factor BamB